MTSSLLLSCLLIFISAVESIQLVEPAAHSNSTRSANATIVAVASNCSLQRSNPNEIVKLANDAKSRFSTAEAKLQKVKAQLKESQSKPEEIKEKQDKLEKVVASSKDEVAEQSNRVAVQRQTLDALEERMESKRRTIAYLRRELEEKRASIVSRKEKLEEQRRVIEKKKKDLDELKNSIGSFDTWRVSREEEELKKLIEAYDEENRDLHWDEISTRDKSGQLQSVSNHWHEGQVLIESAERRLQHAEDSLTYRQSVLTSQELLLRELEQSLNAQLKEDSELRAALDLASWEVEASAHSVIARQGSAIGALKNRAAELDDKSQKQQERLAQAALEAEKQDAAVQGALAHGVQQDLEIGGLKSQIEQYKKDIRQADYEGKVQEGQRAALHTEDARQTVEVHRLRGESAVKRATNNRLEAEAVNVGSQVASAQKAAAAQEARGKHAWDSMNKAAARAEAAKRDLYRAEAGNAYAHDALARRDYVIQSQNEDIWRHESAIDSAYAERAMNDAQNEGLKHDAKEKDRTSRILQDATKRRDEVIRMQNDEIERQRQSIRNNDKLAVSKEATLDGLRDSDIKKDQELKSLSEALDSQKDSLAALEKTLEATQKDLSVCESKGTPDHLAHKLGDFVDALTRSYL